MMVKSIMDLNTKNGMCIGKSVSIQLDNVNNKTVLIDKTIV